MDWFKRYFWFMWELGFLGFFVLWSILALKGERWVWAVVYAGLAFWAGKSAIKIWPNPKNESERKT